MESPVDPANLIGREIGRYRIVRHLASGGMAELYIARQEAMGGFEKEIVLKTLQGKYAENKRVVSMFLDEARLAAKLNHQSIVHVYDVADEDGVKYIAMEYIHGETLTDIIRRGIAVDKYLPLEHAVHVVRQTAAGLAYAHGRREPDGRLLRIVHRDVSPTNILVTYEGQTKIVDFGIARIQDELREEEGILPGKASYMSPEQARGEGADYRSDIFSLGIILWEITLGQRLYRGPAQQVMKRIMEDKVPPPTAIRRDYPPALELIVMRALEKRPDDRYQSAEDLRVDLEEFLADEGLRTGSRRVGIYMNEIFAPETEVATEALGKSREFGEPQAAEGRVRDNSEELNFDRRAPLSMRFEAADDVAAAASAGGPGGGAGERPGARYRAPVPGDLGAVPPAAPDALPKGSNGVHHGGAAGLTGAAAVVAGAAADSGPTGSGAGPARTRSRITDAGAPVVAAPAAGRAEDADREAAAPAASGSAKGSGRALGWVLGAVLLVGIAALVFLGSK